MEESTSDPLDLNELAAGNGSSNDTQPATNLDVNGPGLPRKHMRAASINIMLAGLSCVDILLLVLAVPVFALPQIQMEWSKDIMAKYDTVIYKYLYAVVMMTQTCTIYTLIAITLERWVAVCRPLHVEVWCTIRRIKTAFAGVVIGSVLYNFVRFWEFAKNEDGSLRLNLREWDKHHFYMMWYYTVLYIITHVFVPLSLIVGMNVLAAYRIIRIRRQRKMLNRQVRGEHRTTVMMFAIIVAFILCNSLPFVLNVTEAMNPKFFTEPDTFQFAWALNDACNFLVVANSSCNALLYYMFSVKYRKTLHRLVIILVPCVCIGTRGRLSFMSKDSRVTMRAMSAHTQIGPSQHPSMNALRDEPLILERRRKEPIGVLRRKTYSMRRWPDSATSVMSMRDRQQMSPMQQLHHLPANLSLNNAVNRLRGGWRGTLTSSEQTSRHVSRCGDAAAPAPTGILTKRLCASNGVAIGGLMQQVDSIQRCALYIANKQTVDSTRYYHPQLTPRKTTAGNRQHHNQNHNNNNVENEQAAGMRPNLSRQSLLRHSMPLRSDVFVLAKQNGTVVFNAMPPRIKLKSTPQNCDSCMVLRNQHAQSPTAHPPKSVHLPAESNGGVKMSNATSRPALHGAASGATVSRNSTNHQSQKQTTQPFNQSTRAHFEIGEELQTNTSFSDVDSNVADVSNKCENVPLLDSGGRSLQMSESDDDLSPCPDSVHCVEYEEIMV